jgi:hypothetical protein
MHPTEKDLGEAQFCNSTVTLTGIISCSKFSDEWAQDFVKFAKSPTGQKVFKDAGVLEQTIQLCSKTIKVDK